MENERKQKLIKLGADKLADALLELSAHSESADDLIEQMIASPEENVQRFKMKLGNLKCSRRFIDWRGAGDFSRELDMLLQDLKAGVSDPLTGVELVAAFYEADNTIFEMCDDSSGDIGMVFTHDAKELFAAYASRCADKEKIAELILQLNRKNDYGIRDALIECAGECLPEPVIRSMISTLQQNGGSAGSRNRSHLIESLARQIKDAPLFAETRETSGRRLNSAAWVEIATVYFESGDCASAIEWLNRIAPDETFYTYERDRLLARIYQHTNDTEKLTVLLRQNLKKHHATSTLDELLSVIGQEHRSEVITEEIHHIMAEDKLNNTDLEFLIETDHMDEAEVYLLQRADQLDGSFYGTLIPLAEAFQKDQRSLASSLIFRALLNSILNRAYSKAYHHAVDYLKKLDQLAEGISDWKMHESHTAYKVALQEKHGRKKSFWSQYERAL